MRAFISILSLMVFIFTAPAFAAGTPLFAHIKIEGEIGPATAAYLKRAIDTAKSDNADIFIVEIDTPGGRLDSALTMKDDLLDSGMKTMAVVNRHAYSAGALIALACQEIYMVKGAVIGAAAPVDQEGHKLEEKMVSGTRSVFAATAEHYGRDKNIAAAMVDDEVVIDGVIEEGKLLTLTAEEAVAQKIATRVYDSFEDFKDAKVPEMAQNTERFKTIPPSQAEEIVSFITNPIVASLLLTIAMLAIFAEFKAPGVGYGAVVAVICYGLFFWGHHLAGLAGWEDVALVLGGIFLLAVEIFIVPGFGLFGLAGIMALLAGFYISLIGDLDETPQQILLDTTGIISAALIGTVALMLVAYRFLFKGAGFDSGIVLRPHLAPYRKKRQEAKSFPLKIGDTGTATSDLRPTGTASFHSDKYSVNSDGSFIDADSTIEIIKISGSNITVRIKDS